MGRWIFLGLGGHRGETSRFANSAGSRGLSLRHDDGDPTQGRYLYDSLGMYERTAIRSLVSEMSALTQLEVSGLPCVVRHRLGFPSHRGEQPGHLLRPAGDQPNAVADVDRKPPFRRDLRHGESTSARLSAEIQTSPPAPSQRRVSAPIGIPMRSVACGLTPKSGPETLELALGALATGHRSVDDFGRLGSGSSHRGGVVEAPTNWTGLKSEGLRRRESVDRRSRW